MMPRGEVAIKRGATGAVNCGNEGRPDWKTQDWEPLVTCEILEKRMTPKESNQESSGATNG